MSDKPSKPRTMLRNPALRRARVSRVLASRIAGDSMSKIAGDLNISIDTVKTDLAYAKTHRMLESLEDRVINELIPLAIETFKHKMIEDKDPFVAKTVLEQLTRLSARADRQKEMTAAIDSLAAYRSKRSQSLPTVTVSPSPPVALLEGEVSDAR